MEMVNRGLEQLSESTTIIIKVKVSPCKTVSIIMLYLRGQNSVLNRLLHQNDSKIGQ